MFPSGEPYSVGRGDDLPAGRHPVRGRRAAARPLPQVRPGPARRDRHLRELRAVVRRPTRNDHRSTRRAPARRRGGRLSAGMHGTGIVPPVRPRHDRRRARVRGARRPRRPARQRPPRPGLRAGPPAGLRDRRRHRLVRHRADGRRQRAARPRRVAQPAVAGGHRPHGRGVRAPRRVAGRPRDRRRARAVREPVRVLRRVRDLDPRRLPVPPAPLPDPPDRLHPGRRGARAAALRVVAAVRDRAARPRPPVPGHAHDPRRHGGDLVRDLRDGVRGRDRLPRPGPGGPVRLAAGAQDARRGRVPLGDHRRSRSSRR